MGCSIKLYKINDFIRKNESGELDLEKSRKIVRELADAASSNPESNILVDLRDTTLKGVSMGEILQIAIELALYKSVFKNKMATIIPDTPDRLVTAEQFKISLQYKGFEYNFFTSLDDAIEWFSEIEDFVE